MQTVCLLSDDDLDDVQVGYEGCAEPEFEPFHEKLVKREEQEDAEGDDELDVLAPAAKTAVVNPVVPGVTRSGLQRGKVEVSESVGKKRKYTAKDLPGMKLPKVDASDAGGEASGAAFSLVDEGGSDDGKQGETGDDWPTGLHICDLPDESLPGGSGLNPLNIDPITDAQPTVLPMPAPVRSVPLSAPVHEIITVNVCDNKETTINILDVEKILDSLLPSDLLDSVREFSDDEARRRSDDSIVHQLAWLLDTRRRYQAARNDRQVLQGELEVGQKRVHELKVELANLKSEKASWGELTGEVVELRAVNQSQLDTIAEMKLAVGGYKSDSLNRGLQIEEQRNRICELEGKIAEYVGLVTAKDGQIFVLEQKNKTLDESLAGVLEQVTKEREAKEAALSELAKLRSGLEPICDKVLKDPTVTDPFNAYAQGLMEYGSHRAAVRAQKAFGESPPVFPEELLQMVKPESKAQAKQLFEKAKSAKSAYVAKLVSNPDLSVDELLAIEP